MENLIIRNTGKDIDTILYPSLNFNADTGVCIISGESFIEDPVEFYEPVYEWLNDFFKTKKPLFFILKLSYFNTSSSKIIYEFLFMIKKYKQKGNVVEVEWHHAEEDSEISEEIEDYSKDIGLKIKRVTF